MANSSITLNSGSGGSAVDTDTVTGDGDHMQVVKPSWGPAGTRNLTDTATPLPVMTVPYASGGCSIFRSIDLDESEEEVKATAGQVYGVVFTNTATSTRFLKFYDATAASVVVGTASPPSVPVITIGLPGNASDDVSGVIMFPYPIAFDTAITVAATTAVADTDTGAPGANEVIVNIFYK